MRKNPFRYFSQASPQRNRKRLEMLLKYSNGGTLLDVGCGKGGFLTLADAHFDVVGIDRDPESPEPSATDASLHIIRADVNTLELEPARYDVITMFNLLEHLPDPYRVIEQAHHGLKPGGILYGSVPNNRWFAGKIHTVVSNLFDETHCSTFHPARWLDYFGRAGFKKTRLFGEILAARVGFFCSVPAFWESISFNLMFMYRKEDGKDRRIDSPAAG